MAAAAAILHTLTSDTFYYYINFFSYSKFVYKIIFL